jgi:hypothetical protein
MTSKQISAPQTETQFASRRILVSAEQAGTFSNNNRNIDFRIDSSYGDTLDLSQSYVLATCGLTNLTSQLFRYGVQTTDDYTGSAGIIDKKMAMFNCDLIRNSSLRSNQLGSLEDIREAGLLFSTMNRYTKSIESQNALQMSLHQVSNWASGGYKAVGAALSPFLEERKLGTYPSRYVNPHFKIPLSDILGMGKASQIPVSQLGDMVLHLELEDLNKFEVYVVDEDGYLNSPVNCEDTTSDTNTVQITIDNDGRIDDINNIKFYVGQRVNISYVDANTAAIINDDNCFITDIELLYIAGATEIQSDMTYEITYNGNPIPTGSTDVTITRYQGTPDPAAAGITFQIQTMELALTYLSSPSPQLSMLEYPTFTIEQISVAQQSYEKVIDIEPECVNVFLLFKTGDAMVSNLQQLDKFRLRLDNIDVINRDVKVNYGDQDLFNDIPNAREGYYYDLMNDSFLNGGLTLNNVNEAILPQAPDERSTNSYLRYNDKSLLICVPTNQTQNYKHLQLILKAKAGQIIDRVYVYKHCLKSVQL